MRGRADRLDRVFDALAHPYRRRLLAALAGPDGSDDVDPREALSGVLASAEDEAVVSVELWHRHLPKLDALGFVEWDAAADTLARGPAWAEVEPLLDLLDSDDVGPPGDSTVPDPSG